jgi:hypothetical protein
MIRSVDVKTVTPKIRKHFFDKINEFSELRGRLTAARRHLASRHGIRLEESHHRSASGQPRHRNCQVRGVRIHGLLIDAC